MTLAFYWLKKPLKLLHISLVLLQVYSSSSLCVREEIFFLRNFLVSGSRQSRIRKLKLTDRRTDGGKDRRQKCIKKYTLTFGSCELIKMVSSFCRAAFIPNYPRVACSKRRCFLCLHVNNSII